MNNFDFFNLFNDDDGLESILKALRVPNSGLREEYSGRDSNDTSDEDGYVPIRDVHKSENSMNNSSVRQTEPDNKVDALSRQIAETDRMHGLYMKATKRISYLENENAAYKAQLEKLSGQLSEYRKKFDILSKLLYSEGN